MIGWLGEHHPDEPGEWYQVAIAEREAPDLLIGDCGFRPRADEPLVVDIGFTLGPAAQGRGYATEAIGELLRYLFEDRGKHKVCADCDTRNDPSWRLLERLGFAREGTLRGGYRDGDAWSDEHLYGLLAVGWRGDGGGRGGPRAARRRLWLRRARAVPRRLARMTTRRVAWRRSDEVQADEHCTINLRDSGLSLIGTVLGAEDGVPVRVEYRVLADAAGATTGGPRPRPARVRPADPHARP